MSTRASISRVNDDGTITSIYSHWDGYPSWVGKKLLDNYNKDDIVTKLLSLGDISSLDDSIDKPEGHTFETPKEGYTIFYGRDRGEEGVEPRTHKTKEEFADYWKDSWCEYFYQFRNGQWYYGKKPTSINSKLTTEVVERD